MDAPTQYTPSRSAPTSDDFHSGDRKRRRKALSCFECRRRKLRCDREYPVCGRCRAQAHSCSYETGPFEGSPVAPTPNTQKKKPDAEHSRTLDSHSPNSNPWVPGERTNNLPNNQSENHETLQPSGVWQSFGQVALVGPADARPSAPGNFPTSVRSAQNGETIYFKGTSFTTQYYGGTNPTSQISHFPELRSFMKEAIMQHSSLPRVQRDVKALQVIWKSEKAQAHSFQDSTLIDLLPAQEQVDHLCQLYFDTFENTYRILHGPAFWKEYHALWNDPKAARSAFVVTVLLMMATVSCISSKERPTYIGDSSAAREAAVLWIEAGKSWLRRQSQKHVYLAVWQIRCLLLLATLSNILKKKRAWTTAGHLMRQAMSAGFHRDPNLLGANISVFDQEMRRRLWATMVELELQTSIDRGMSSALAGISSDTSPPINVDDDEFDEEIREPPAQKPADKFTAASFLRISRSSLSLRVTLNSALNELGRQISYEEVLHYDEQINEKLKEIPTWRTRGGSQKVSPSLDIPRAVLDIQLRQFLLMLHSPFARRAESDSRYSMSKMVCFNAASRILDQHSKLVASGNYALSFFRQDIFRSSLLICHFVYVSSVVPNDLSLFKLSQGFFPYIDNALSILEDRITRLGTGYTHYWYVAAANALVHSKVSSGNSAAQKQQVVDKVLKQYYKVLASQDDIPAVKEKAPFNGVHKPKAVDTTMATFDELLASQLPQMPDPQYEFYYGDPAAWVFDNLPTFDQLDVPGLM